MKRKICGKIASTKDMRIGGPRNVCTKDKDHSDEHGEWKHMLQIEHAEAMNEGIEKDENK